MVVVIAVVVIVGTVGVAVIAVVVIVGVVGPVVVVVGAVVMAWVVVVCGWRWCGGAVSAHAGTASGTP